MIQIDPLTYLVGAQENVEVEVEAVQTGNTTGFSVDGEDIPPDAGVIPRTFSFQVSVGPGLTHFGTVDCHFDNSAPDTAQFRIFVSGDQGGGRFTGPVVKKTHSLQSRDLEFRRS